MDSPLKCYLFTLERKCYTIGGWHPFWFGKEWLWIEKVQMKQSTGRQKSAWFWVGVALLSISALWWILLMLSVENKGDAVLAGAITTFIPIGIGIYGVWHGRKAPVVEKPRVPEAVAKPVHGTLQFIRNFLILLLAAGGIVGVSVLLISRVNETLGYIVGPLLVVFLVVPLVQILRRSGKLFTKDQLIGRLPEVTGGVLALLIMWGCGWGFAHVFESWHEGWGWIGWIVGWFVVGGGGGFALVLVWMHRTTRGEYERDKLTAYQNVLEKPGISHTALLKTVERDNATDVLRELLREKRIKLERRGRVRRYFAQYEDYDEAIRQNPEDAEAYYKRGIAYKVQGNKAKAITDFEKFITLTNNPKLTKMAKQQIEELSK